MDRCSDQELEDEWTDALLRIKGEDEWTEAVDD